MNSDLLNIIVTAIVFVFLLSIFIQYFLDWWHKLPERNILYAFKEGFEEMLDSKENSSSETSFLDASNNNVNDTSTPSTGPTGAATGPTTSGTGASAGAGAAAPVSNTIPANDDSEPIDYATENATNITELFDKVNVQTDIIRTLKQPYSDKYDVVKYDPTIGDENTDINTTIFSNLTTLLRNAIQKNDEDMKTNSGITSIFQYSGNDSIGELINELTMLTADNIKKKHEAVSTASCTTGEGVEKTSCINKIYKQFDRKMEADYIKRVMKIVDAHQKIIDRILEKKSKL